MDGAGSAASPSVGRAAALYVESKARSACRKSASIWPADGYRWGETEDYLFVPKIPEDDLDFGDAPYDGDLSRYPTLLAHNGARHKVDPDVFLGEWVEEDGDGRPTMAADGDDYLDATDDEDGVFIPGLRAGAKTRIGVIASTEGYLSGWIDWVFDNFDPNNIDPNDFDKDNFSYIKYLNPGEFEMKDVHLGTDVTPVGVDTYVFDISVPEDVTLENKSFFMRFRLCEEEGKCNSLTDNYTTDNTSPSIVSLFGMNALFVYFLNHMVDVSDINKFFFGWLSGSLGDFRDIFFSMSRLGLICLLLYYMYVKRIFIRV